MRGAIIALERQWYRQAERDRQLSNHPIWKATTQAWGWLVRSLSHSHEPRLWTKLDSQGHVHWYVRDPITGQRLEQASEHEVRVWLEQRYHR
ncbi:MAG: hypothetical protein HC838_02140 [Spirulinaceae cyanobacterium RM2_2_10]|nr:hypothetical protein [Spirulinaceae cyanobacterium RM2_2_10]